MAKLSLSICIKRKMEKIKDLLSYNTKIVKMLNWPFKKWTGNKLLNIRFKIAKRAIKVQPISYNMEHLVGKGGSGAELDDNNMTLYS